jgi:hypothetical protein
MLLEIIRRVPSKNGATIGKLYINRAFFCDTLEDEVRAKFIKVPGATAIPAGEYIVILDWSSRFKREMPRLLYVSMFEGVRIHAGNTAADTEGCILVGLRDSDHGDTILHSRDTFNQLFDRLKAAFQKETICISIRNEPCSE